MKRFVVVGLGNFGSSVAEALHTRGHEVIVVDNSPKAVDRMAPFVTRAAVGDGRDLQTLERLGARDADAGVVSTGDDIAASILATMALRDAGVKDIYAKVISRDHARVMDRIGVTETIFPERESALSLGTRMCGMALLSYTSLGPGFGLQEMAVPTSWTGKTLVDLDLRKSYGINVVAVRDVLTGKFDIAPKPEESLDESETVVLAGREDDLARVAQIA